MNKDYYNALKKMIDTTRTDCLLELRVGIKGKVTVYDLANEKPISTMKCIIIWLKNKCDFFNADLDLYRFHYKDYKNLNGDFFNGLTYEIAVDVYGQKSL